MDRAPENIHENRNFKNSMGVGTTKVNLKSIMVNPRVGIHKKNSNHHNKVYHNLSKVSLKVYQVDKVYLKAGIKKDNNKRQRRKPHNKVLHSREIHQQERKVELLLLVPQQVKMENHRVLRKLMRNGNPSNLAVYLFNN